MQEMIKYGCLVLFILTIIACDKTEVKTRDLTVDKILHISHMRDYTEGFVHPKLKNIPLDFYEMHLLGGDLDLFTTGDLGTIKKWDDLFNLSVPTTLWTLGNHDTSNRNLVEEFTERPSFYTYSDHDICFLVLDTELDLSNIIGEQLELVNAVADTISNSKHLIVLTHKLLWLQGNEELSPYLETVPNGEPGDCGYCTNPNNFYQDVYPRLIEVQDRGIQVWCIAGDIGMKVSEFSYRLPEGVEFMASGLNITQDGNKIIELERKIGDEMWSWKYSYLEDL